MHYDCTFASVMSKFGSKDSSHLLYDWCGDVGIQDIAHLNLDVIQGSKVRARHMVSRDTTLA